jgi:hypothetical protein
MSELSDDAHQVDQESSCERRLRKKLTAFDPGIVTMYWPALRSLAFSCTAGSWGRTCWSWDQTCLQKWRGKASVVQGLLHDKVL